MDRVELSRLLWRSLGHEPGKIPPPEDPRVLVSSTNPLGFMAVLAAASGGQGEVFLGNPAWGDNERAQLAALFAGVKPERRREGWLCIPTGGTSGQLKFARHDERTLAAAVAGFTRHFGLTKVNAVGVLPLYHVSGLMAWLRCALTGGDYRSLDWKAVEAGERPLLPEQADGWVISLVPTQLERLLRQPGATAWLRKFRIIFVGGGPTRPELLDEAAAAGLPISLGYGMTETAAMVAALRPEEFLAGARTCGQVLPHAQVRVAFDGALTIASEALFRGYYPAWRHSEWFVTADLGGVTPHGQVTVSGRRDEVIISGGEKVDPAEIMMVLRACGQFAECLVLGVPDAEWGQVVVVAYPADNNPQMSLVDAAVEKLAPQKRPKRYVALPDWPVNAQGKVNRHAVMMKVQLQLNRN